MAGGAVLAGGSADALITLHLAETQRRDRIGTGAVTNLALLDLFLSMPLGQPLSWADLSREQRRLLRGAPDGAIHVEGGQVTRLLDHPVRVEAALVRSRSWRDGLRRAGRFAGVTESVVLLPAGVRVAASKLWEADVVGVGVWTEGPLGHGEVVPAAACRPARVSAALWRFEERAYRAWLAATMPVPPVPGTLPWPDS